MFVHGAERSREVGGTLRAIETLRWYSMALGSGTIALTYLLALGLFPHESWRCGFAAALVGLNPMFLFISNSVNNDNLVVLLFTAFALALVTLHRMPYRAWHPALLGALAGVATLAKASALIALPAIAISIGLRVEDGKRRWMALAACLGAWVSLCGWWLLRNLLVYGEFLASSAHTALAQNNRRHWKPFALIVEWDGFLKSYWGVFGAFNVIYPDAVYTAFFALTLLGLGSLALWWRRSHRRVRSDVVLFALCVALNLLAVAWWTSHLKGSQGRLMFPTLAAASVLYAVGLDAWRRRLRVVLAASIFLLLLGFALYAALDVIPRQYPAAAGWETSGPGAQVGMLRAFRWVPP
jgi:4-amino-4-deoxy-L-arabinose transferase-like glycosyltransferase